MALSHSLDLLVPTKLAPPQPRETWIPRERLIARLADHAQARLTLVVAPAGFGKSTLAAQWLAQLDALCAWLTLDEHDQDPLRFCAYLAGAIERAAPGALASSRALLAAPDPPPFVVLQAILVDLSALAVPLTIVLDDYHVVTVEAVHKTVAYLLRHMPPGCRVVLLSRVDPPLPLTRLRAELQLAEVRAGELRFTEEEAAALLAGMLHTPPEAALVSALHARTEGWVIALQLAALARLDARSPDRAVSGLDRQITEYLADEVFDQQPIATQLQLLALAVPERFCAGLCAALLATFEDVAQAEGLLEQLARANLFLTPLDREGAWYRFHPLFRDLLLRRLRLAAGHDHVRALNARAARWFAGEGLVEEAVRHALAAGDDASAADLVERMLLPEMARDVPGASLGYWLRLLPEELIARRPGLALIMARLAVFSMDIGDFQAKLACVDALLARMGAPASYAPWPTFQADLAAMHGILCYWQGRPAETIRAMHAALAQGPTLALATQAMLQLGVAYVSNGSYAEGVRLIEEGLPAAQARLGELYPLYQHSCLANMHLIAGELAAQTRAAARLAEEVAARAPGDLWLGYAAASSGYAAYERSDLAAAAAHFGALTARKYKVSYPGYIGGVIGMALIACAGGALDEAAAHAREALAFADELGGVYLRHQALGCAVRVALARGDLAGALRAAEGIGPDLHLGLSISFETPRLSKARALIAAGDAVALAQAEQGLAQCRAEIESLHNTRLLIAALAVQALLRQAQGRPGEAEAALEQAVQLAAPLGFARTFLDLGPALAEPMRRLAARGVAPDYVGRLLDADGGRAAPAPQPRVAALSMAVGDLLTRRELEILGLLAERWSDKEIAEQLVIAPNTVRKHTSTIYDKLGVSSRREAVEVAVTLGLVALA